MKAVNYHTLGMALRVIADACFEADRQQRNGERVTACGMSDEDLENLCEQIPYLMNPYMTAGQVKREAHISESTLRRAIASGEMNTQRIVDVLNNHWQSDLQQRYNDARLELSQQRQNAELIAALKTTTTTTT